jgi:uncharacterized membrane protein
MIDRTFIQFRKTQQRESGQFMMKMDLVLLAIAVGATLFVALKGTASPSFKALVAKIKAVKSKLIG